jgi:hypothetical protein
LAAASLFSASAETRNALTPDKSMIPLLGCVPATASGNRRRLSAKASSVTSPSSRQQITPLFASKAKLEFTFATLSFDSVSSYCQAYPGLSERLVDLQPASKSEQCFSCSPTPLRAL